MKRFVGAETPVGHKPANQSQIRPQKKEKSKLSDEKKKNLVNSDKGSWFERPSAFTDWRRSERGRRLSGSKQASLARSDGGSVSECSREACRAIPLVLGSNEHLTAMPFP